MQVVEKFIKTVFDKGETLELEDLIHNLDKQKCYFMEKDTNELLKLIFKDKIDRIETNNLDYISIIYNNGNIVILSVA